MKRIATIRQLLSLPLFCLLLLISFSIKAQPIDWKERYDKTLIYEISNKEAEKLLKKHHSNDTLIRKMLHTQVAILTDKWEEKPDRGHFIYVNINKNNVTYDYRPVLPFQVFLFKEYGVFTLQVIDAQGNIRGDAKVKIKKGGFGPFNARVHFDKESQTYTIEDDSDRRSRILTVELDKFRAVFDLTKHIVTPRYSYGDDYSSSPDFYSYMITDKNKYKPGETVRFKSYALTGGKRPLKKELNLQLRTFDYRDKTLATISPYNPGGYAGELQLHDSLRLTLDRDYYIQLVKPNRSVVASTRFRYEDYELYDSRLEAKLLQPVQYYPNANRLEIKATDANGLLLQDVKASILVKRGHVSSAYTDVLTLPDTLMLEQLTLNNTTPTIVDIPASIFGDADCAYSVHVEVKTFDNQPLNAAKNASYFRSRYEVFHTTSNDTITIGFKELGEEKQVKATLGYNGSTEKKEVDLPYSEPFKQTIHSYNIQVKEPHYKQNINVRDIRSLLSLEGGIAADSFNIQLINPLALDVSWYIYQGNMLLEKGSGKEFDFKYSNADLDLTHYVEVFYVMGDKENAYRRVFVPKKEFLTVNLDLPERVYPGQTLDAKVSVEDYMGAPVKNVDLTAFAVNSQLNYHIPDLPYYGGTPQAREKRSSYDVDKRMFSYTAPLNYKFWKSRVELEEQDYYRFSYPLGKLFTYVVDTPDTLTQFAPYVMKNGNAVNIFVIEDNGEPVYFSWTEQPKAYSFAVSDNVKHRISLRLYDRVILFDSIQFAPGKKTILSIDLDHLPKEGIKVMKIESKKDNRYTFTGAEHNRYSQYISRLPVASPFVYSYLQGKSVYPIFHPDICRPVSQVLAGPIPQARYRYAGGYTNSVEYKHEGGYAYEFEEAVVYKRPAEVVPQYLNFSLSPKFYSSINDFYYSPSVFSRLVKEAQESKRIWYPSSIHMLLSDMSLKLRIPATAKTTGVVGLMFKDRNSENIVIPDSKMITSGGIKNANFPPSVYDVILLYSDGRYIQRDSVAINKHCYIEVDMSNLPIADASSMSEEWRQKFLYQNVAALPNVTFLTDYFTAKSKESSTARYAVTAFNEYGNIVKGVVFAADDNSPLPYATVVVKGEPYVVTTDMDGMFQINIDGYEATLVFSFVGMASQEVIVNSGSFVTVSLDSDYNMLEESIVVAYGVRIRGTLAGAVAGVSVRSTHSDSSPQTIEDDEVEDDEAEAAEDRLYQELIQLGGLRSNFSDVGFWQPSLVTDRKGEAEFTVTFPDNITKWDATVYAMNRRLQTGTLRKSILSYKPIMAELRSPQFLVEGDTSRFVGNIRSYTRDKEIVGSIMFAQGQDTLMNKGIEFSSSHQDQLFITASSTDSITSTYLFTRNDGYIDGEKRSINVVPKGTELADGTLQLLRNGDRLSISAADNEEVHVAIAAKQLDVYVNTAGYLMGYMFDCNEQLASKLIGLLSYKLYREYEGKPFRHNDNINTIIRRLVNNRNTKDKLWSWWGQSSETSFWMSAHILRALNMAKDAGYQVKLDMTSLEQDYVDVKPYKHWSIRDIEILHAVSEWGAEQNYKASIELFEKEIARLEAVEDSLAYVHKREKHSSYLKEKLLLWEMRQKYDIGYSTDSVAQYLKKDVFGGVYCDDGIKRYWYSDDLQTTLIAYRMAKRDSALMHHIDGMQLYILGTKRSYWNTYQSTSVISTVFPDLLKESFSKESPATVLLRGKDNKQLNEFPYNVLLKAGEQLDIEKESGMPLIYSSYTIKRATEENIGDAFEVSTYFTEGNKLKAGEPVKLTAEVKVKQRNAEHVMIEIPIPAGCSYVSKGSSRYYTAGANRYYYEQHRESFKEKVVIFCESLPPDTYYFEVSLLPRYTGSYTLNPAKVEMMYFPVINANNDLRKVEIND